jgi:hypothetical protein
MSFYIYQLIEPLVLPNTLAYQLSVISYKLSAKNYQLAYQLKAINYLISYPLFLLNSAIVNINLRKRNTAKLPTFLNHLVVLFLK